MPGPSSKSDNILPDEIRRTLRLLCEPGDVVELRIPRAGKKAVHTGYFHNTDKLIEAASTYSGCVPALYVNLNRINPALIARSENDMEDGISSSTDKDVLVRRNLLIDIDPERPSDISSTDEE